MFSSHLRHCLTGVFVLLADVEGPASSLALSDSRTKTLFCSLCSLWSSSAGGSSRNSEALSGESFDDEYTYVWSESFSSLLDVKSYWTMGDTSAFHSYRTEGWICRVINHQKSERFCVCRHLSNVWEYCGWVVCCDHGETMACPRAYPLGTDKSMLPERIFQSISS